MKVDLSKALLDLDGNEIKEAGKVINYYSVFRTALVGDFTEKSATEKFEDFKTALKLKADEVELTIEELARVKKLVSNIPSTLIVGRTLEFIENLKAE